MRLRFPRTASSSGRSAIAIGVDSRLETSMKASDRFSGSLTGGQTSPGRTGHAADRASRPRGRGREERVLFDARADKQRAPVAGHGPRPALGDRRRLPEPYAEAGVSRHRLHDLADRRFEIGRLLLEHRVEVGVYRGVPAPLDVLQKYQLSLPRSSELHVVASSSFGVGQVPAEVRRHGPLGLSAHRASAARPASCRTGAPATDAGGHPVSGFRSSYSFSCSRERIFPAGSLNQAI